MSYNLHDFISEDKKARNEKDNDGSFFLWDNYDENLKRIKIDLDRPLDALHSEIGQLLFIDMTGEGTIPGVNFCESFFGWTWKR